jgi:tellurium resistance protein TerZ
MQLIKKGQSIELKKKDGTGLTSVAIGLGWGRREVSGGFLAKLFSGDGSVDLDASCISYDGSKNPVDAIWFGNLRSRDGSITHTGDDLTGGGTANEPNEVINVDLHTVPGHISSIVFVVNSYSGETFSGIPSAFCNVVDNTTRTEIARYNLNTDGRDYKGFIIAKVSRQGSAWSFSAIGESCSGRQRTVDDIEPQARSHAS